MERLEFKNDTHHTGLNYTVRVGTKWKSLDPGSRVYINSQGVCDVHSIHVCRFADIPDTILEGEHDPTCTTMDGLTKALFNFYPDELDDIKLMEFNDTIVTCIGYIVL